MSDRDTNKHALDARTLTIRKLNDHLRTTWSGGKIWLTPGVEEMGPHLMLRALRLVSEFDEFGPNNDPFEEHDFGAISVEGEQLFWKIDYYDPDMINGSPDPADEAVNRQARPDLQYLRQAIDRAPAEQAIDRFHQGARMMARYKSAWLCRSFLIRKHVTARMPIWSFRCARS